MSISNGAVKPWLHGYLDSAEEVFSKEIADSSFVPNHNTFANRALLRGRSGNGSEALKDANQVTCSIDFLRHTFTREYNQSLSIQTSAIGQIAKTVAIINGGEHELARQEIPKVLETGDSDQHIFLLKVIQVCI